MDRPVAPKYPEFGKSRQAGARFGMVTLIQRFGSSLNLNVHLHLLVLDGVFAPAQGRQHFHNVAAPDTQTLQVLLG